MWVTTTASFCSCQKLLYSMPDVSVAMLACACTFAIAMHKCLLKLAHFYPLLTSVSVWSWQHAPAISCLLVLSKNIFPLASTHIQQTGGSGHVTAALTSTDKFARTYQEEAYFRTIYTFCKKNKTECRILNTDKRNTLIYSQAVFKRKTSNRKAIRKSDTVCGECRKVSQMLLK